jgi:hypothetical protein
MKPNKPNPLKTMTALLETTPCANCVYATRTQLGSLCMHSLVTLFKLQKSATCSLYMAQAQAKQEALEKQNVALARHFGWLCLPLMLLAASTLNAGEWYLQPQGGLVKPLTASASSSGLNGSLSFKEGYAAGLQGGYRFDNGLALGLEGDYLRFETRHLTLGDPALAAFGGYYDRDQDYDEQLFPLMATASYRYYLPLGFVAEAGAGVGQAKTAIGRTAMSFLPASIKWLAIGSWEPESRAFTLTGMRSAGCRSTTLI